MIALKGACQGRNPLSLGLNCNTAVYYESIKCMQPMLDAACGLQDARLQDIGKLYSESSYTLSCLLRRIRVPVSGYRL
jgi:hypothetical protein